MDMIQLQEKFIGDVLDTVDVDWDRIDVHYEIYESKGEVCEKYTALLHQGPHSGPFSLSYPALETVLALNRCKPEGQAEKWTSFDFTLAADGKYSFDYHYGVPPLVAVQLNPT